MRETLPSKRDAILILQENGCSKKVINHSIAVAKLAVEIAAKINAKGFKVCIELVEIGALLHDIGRSKTHEVHHAVIGAALAESIGLPRRVVSIIKKHVGGGITHKEAQKLGWPTDNIYVPETLEEKIVTYADKLIEGMQQVQIEETIKKLSKELRPSVIERIKKLHSEITALIGDD